MVFDIEDYEKDKAEKTVKDGKGWLSLDELKATVEE